MRINSARDDRLMGFIRPVMLAAALLAGVAAAQSTGATKASRPDPAVALAGTWVFRSGSGQSASCILVLTSAKLMSDYRMTVSEDCVATYTMFMGADRWKPSSSKLFKLYVGQLRDPLLFQRRQDGSYRGKSQQDGREFIMMRAEPEAEAATGQ